MKFIAAFGELTEYRAGPHNGIDLPFPDGTTLRTLVDGVVYAVRDYGNKNIGKGVIIKTDDGNFHIFGHMSKVTVSKGDKIQGGDIIGMSGNTGHTIGANGGYHLHFGIQNPQGEFLDPTKYREALTAISGDASPIEIANAVNSVDDSGFGGWMVQQFNDFSDWFVGKEVEFIVKPFAGLIKELFITLWEWFVFNLPNIMGYTTYLAAIIIILSAMTGKGMIKPFGAYAALLILAVCILGGV